MIFDDNNSQRGYQFQDQETGGGEDEGTPDINQLMVQTLHEIMKELRQKPKTSSSSRYKKEFHLVDFPTFSRGNQNLSYG